MVTKTVHKTVPGGGGGGVSKGGGLACGVRGLGVEEFLGWRGLGHVGVGILGAIR